MEPNFKVGLSPEGNVLSAHSVVFTLPIGLHCHTASQEPVMKVVMRSVVVWSLALPSFAAAQSQPFCRVEVREALRLGSIHGADSFGTIMDLAFDDAGRIYVLDNQAAAIFAFTKDGRFLKKIGRRGGGPGEFVNPYRIAVGGKNLFVFDKGAGRLVRLTLDGKEITSVPLDAVTLGQPYLSVDMQNGFLYLAAPPRDSVATKRPTILQYSLDLKLRREFGTVRLPPGDWPHLSSGWIEAGPTGLLFGPMGQYEFYLYDSSGRAVRSFNRANAFQFAPRPFIQEQPAADGGKLAVVDWNRAISISTGTDVSGNIWHFVRDTPHRRIVADVFRQDGSWIATSSWPLETAPSSLRKQILFGITTRDGFPQLTFYRYALRPQQGQKGKSC
jgi:hypothetical protein